MFVINLWVIDVESVSFKRVENIKCNELAVQTMPILKGFFTFCYYETYLKEDYKRTFMYNIINISCTQISNHIYIIFRKMEDKDNTITKKNNYNKNDYSLGIGSLKITSSDIVGKEDTF